GFRKPHSNSDDNGSLTGVYRQIFMTISTTKTCMPRRALITGITSQDGSYLAELLASKGL
ncbi:MAG TPA: hypothetical protein VKB88_43660, partial [Bryobacteraceae bacterium]|nr:hypothetical protein [Bryobacteraceae bacterium]